MSSKRWLFYSLAAVLFMLGTLGVGTAVIDPFFHYHAPLEEVSYYLGNQRSQNKGIVEHFSYDAIIAGTSMTENFKTSEFDELFQTKSIKTPFSGGTLFEHSRNLMWAAESNPNIVMVLQGLDYELLLRDKDALRNDLGNYPNYLYDDILLNDVYYLFNKEVLFRWTGRALLHTLVKAGTTSFDEYSNWTSAHKFGRDVVLSSYSRPSKSNSCEELTFEEREMLLENLEQNIVLFAQENPDVKYYIFIPPYSIFWWDGVSQKGELEKQFQIEEEMIKLLLEYENIYLFSFSNQFDLVCNAENYKDSTHYHESVNSQILRWISEGKGLLTKDNYLGYCQEIRDFYSSYDYDSLFS